MEHEMALIDANNINRLFPIKINDNIGFINQNGQIVIKPYYNSEYGFHEGFCIIYDDTNSYCIDHKGKIRFKKNKYEPCLSECVSDGMLPFTINDRYGFMDHNGKILIKPNFKSAFYFLNGVANVHDGKLNGFIDKSGEYVISPQFKMVKNFSCERSFVWNGSFLGEDHWALIDKKGNLLSDYIYEPLSSFNDDMAFVMKNTKFGYIDINNNYLPLLYEPMEIFTEGLAVIFNKDNGLFGFINKNGTLAIEPKYYQASSFTCGLSLIKFDSHGKFGYINNKGELVIACVYDEAEIFKGGLAKVSKAGCMYYINTIGEIIWEESQSHSLYSLESNNIIAYKEDRKYYFLKKLINLFHFDRDKLYRLFGSINTLSATIVFIICIWFSIDYFIHGSIIPGLFTLLIILPIFVTLAFRYSSVFIIFLIIGAIIELVKYFIKN